MQAAGTDAIGALRWGLKRYRWVFLACLVLIGSLAPAAALRLQAPFEAEAQVIAQRLNMELIALPRYGEAVFSNGAVAQAVAADFGDLGDFDGIIPDRVRLVATQDSIVFRVIGRDPDPQVAADVANTAADAFIRELNDAGVGVGTFALQSPAEPPPESDQRVGIVAAVGVALSAAIVLGLAVVSLLLILRRPVITPEDAEEATGVTALGTVAIPRAPRGGTAPPQEFGGLVPVCRRLLALPTPTVLLLSRRRPREERARQLISTALAEVLMRVRDVRHVGGATMRAEPGVRRPTDPDPGDAEPSGRRFPGHPVLTVVDGSEPLALLQPQNATVSVLVVPEGIGGAALRGAVVEHLGGSAEPRILLVRRGRRWRDTPAHGSGSRGSVPPQEAVVAGSEL